MIQDTVMMWDRELQKELRNAHQIAIDVRSYFELLRQEDLKQEQRKKESEAESFFSPKHFKMRACSSEVDLNDAYILTKVTVFRIF